MDSQKNEQPLKYFGFKSQDEFVTMLKQGEYNVEFVRFVTANIIGDVECSFTVPAHTISTAPDTLKKGFDASSLYPERINESDKLACFDPATARILPIVYHTETPGFDRKWKEAVIFGDIIDADGQPYVYDSRGKLKQVLKLAGEIAGADRVFLGPELEFFLFKADADGNPLIVDDNPVPMDDGEYFKGGRHGRVRKEVQLLMSEMGYEFEYDHHEVAHSQHEIDVHYMDALSTADFVILYRYIVKRVARAHGLFASFMPKPVFGINGSGMHVHQSLFSKGHNLFFNDQDLFHLSPLAYQYMAGLMKYIPEITLFLNQFVNSYKRLIPGYEAPVYICWDPQNRSNLIRKPQYMPGNELATRLELRSPDPAANPYLGFALMIAAGLRGISEKLPKPAPSGENVYACTPERLEELGIRTLPRSLEEAIHLAEQSTLVKETLGERFLDDYLFVKKKEVEAFYAAPEADPFKLTKYEREVLLPAL